MYLLGALGFGLLISTIADTQALAFQIGLLTSLLPADAALRVSSFPIRTMPVVPRAITEPGAGAPLPGACCADHPEGAGLGPYVEQLALLAALRGGDAGAGLAAAWPGGRREVRTLWHVIVKELLQLRRDHKMLPLIFAAPILQIVAFGYAVNTEVRDVPMVVVDQDRSPGSRELVDRFVASGYFTLLATRGQPARASIPGWCRGAHVALVIGRRLRRRAHAAATPRACR